jgi:hypothetical protein
LVGGFPHRGVKIQPVGVEIVHALDVDVFQKFVYLRFHDDYALKGKVVFVIFGVPVFGKVMREVFGVFHREAVGALGEAFPFVSDVVKAFAVECYPATPDSLGVLPKAKLHELM